MEPTEQTHTQNFASDFQSLVEVNKVEIFMPFSTSLQQKLSDLLRPFI